MKIILSVKLNFQQNKNPHTSFDMLKNILFIIHNNANKYKGDLLRIDFYY